MRIHVLTDEFAAALQDHVAPHRLVGVVKFVFFEPDVRPGTAQQVALSCAVEPGHAGMQDGADVGRVFEDTSRLNRFDPGKNYRNTPTFSLDKTIITLH